MKGGMIVQLFARLRPIYPLTIALVELWKSLQAKLQVGKYDQLHKAIPGP